MKPNHNPFSTTAVRPGVIPFFAMEGVIKKIAQRWRSAGGIGQIIGPHGVGKTTLALSLATKSADKNMKVRRITIRNKSPSVFSTQFVEVIQERFVNSYRDAEFFEPAESHQNQLWIVDGLERLNWLNRYLLIMYCRQKGIDLLVTSHRKVAGIPVLMSLAPSPETFCEIASHLLAKYAPIESNLLDQTTIMQAYVDANGNFRDAFMALYDKYEVATRRNMCKAG